MIRLKTMLANSEQMKEVLGDTATVVPSATMKTNKQTPKKKKTPASTTENAMETDGATDKVERVFSQKTLKDQFGSYPVWMGRTHIQKRTGSTKKKARLARKKNNKGGKRK